MTSPPAPGDRRAPSVERGNLFADLPPSAPEELFAELFERQGLRIERIASYGQASPEGFWYEQEDGEWVLVVSGRAGLEIAGEPEILELGPGDYVDIPARRRHRVAWTAPDEPTIWLAVHYPPGWEPLSGLTTPLPDGMARRESGRR